MEHNEKEVLIVEDEESLAQVYKIELEDEFEVNVATTGKQALTELTPNTDLVFLDRRLGEVSGSEVLERIRGDPEVSTRVIMVTAVDPGIEVLNMDIEGYISKPVDKEDLMKAAKQAFLMDEYESLVNEYYQLQKKHAMFTGIYSRNEIKEKDDGTFEQLETRIEAIEDRLSKVIAAFPDESLTKSFVAAHDGISV